MSVEESEAYANASNFLQRRWEDLGSYSINLRNQLAAPPETESESEEEEREAELELPNTDSSEEDTDSGAESDATQDNATRPTTRPSTRTATDWPPEPPESLNLGSLGR